MGHQLDRGAVTKVTTFRGWKQESSSETMATITFLNYPRRHPLPAEFRAQKWVARVVKEASAKPHRAVLQLRAAGI